MVAIGTGTGVGLERSSASILGSRGQIGSLSTKAAGDGVFLNAANGNLVITRQDEFLVGLGPDIALSRTYNSLAARRPTKPIPPNTSRSVSPHAIDDELYSLLFQPGQSRLRPSYSMAAFLGSRGERLAGVGDRYPATVALGKELDTESLWSAMRTWRPVLGAKAIPFAVDGGGNAFFLDVTKQPSPVRICLHDDHYRIVDVADSLADFVDGLRTDPDLI